jgi:hypothetical protein
VTLLKVVNAQESGHPLSWLNVLKGSEPNFHTSVFDDLEDWVIFSQKFVTTLSFGENFAKSTFGCPPPIPIPENWRKSNTTQNIVKKQTIFSHNFQSFILIFLIRSQ